jgi:uncharacterized protein YaeQ
LLELYQDKDNKNIFSPTATGNRTRFRIIGHLTFFNEVWSFTKKLFNDKPQAWSVDKLASLE